MAPFEYFPIATQMTAYPIPTIKARLTATLGGVAALNDGTGGIFYFDIASVAAPDGVNVFAPDVGAGRWLRLTLDSAGPQQKAFTIAASVWTWTHNLGRKLAGIQAFDDSGNLMATDIQQNTDNLITAVHLYNATGYLRGV